MILDLKKELTKILVAQNTKIDSWNLTRDVELISEDGDVKSYKPGNTFTLIINFHIEQEDKK